MDTTTNRREDKAGRVGVIGVHEFNRRRHSRLNSHFFAFWNQRLRLQVDWLRYPTRKPSFRRYTWDMVELAEEVWEESH